MLRVLRKHSGGKWESPGLFFPNVYLHPVSLSLSPCCSLLSEVIVADFSLQPLGTWLMKLLPVKLVPQWLRRAEASHDGWHQTLASVCSGGKTDVMFAVIELKISANLGTLHPGPPTAYWNSPTSGGVTSTQTKVSTCFVLFMPISVILTNTELNTKTFYTFLTDCQMN